MKKNAYADTTIKATAKRLRHLELNTNLNNPEQVKGFIATKQCGNGYKECLTETYDLYCQANNITWNKPFYQRYHKLPKIPKTEHLNLLIANARPKMALFLSMSKDLGTRPVELTWLKTKDIDLNNGAVSLTSAKHCNGRTLKLKKRTLEMLKQHIAKKKLTQDDRLFPTTSDLVSDSYRRLRNKLAEKLQTPVIAQIRLYDFRHYYASTLYHKTKDLLLVKVSMGHKDLRQTLMYTQLLDTTEEDEYTCKVAKTLQEATQLIEKGFTYVAEMEGMQLYKKRK
jgi:integrase